MAKQDKKLKRFLQIFSGIAIVLTLIPLVAIDYWWIRIFDFPHIQLTVLTVIAFLTYFIRFNFRNWKDYTVLAMLIGCMIFQYTKIHAYTPYASKMALDASPEKLDEKFSIFTANVYQDNEKPEKLQAEIKKKDADVLLFLETNKRWQKDIRAALSPEYKYRVEIPLDNTYGMLLYSKLELINPRKRFLVDEEIPSIQTKLVLATGDTIQLFALHPTPPMPQHNPSSTDRDAEMMKIANLSRKSNYPVIAIGDFNDVAWSATTSLFYKVGELLDPRQGRGFYNTFNANNIIMRWPLDHIFISSEFRIHKLERGPDVDSDHFPTYSEITFEPELKDEQMPDDVTENELKRAQEQAAGIRKVELDY